MTLGRLLTPSMDAFGLSRGAALTTILSVTAALILAVFWFFFTAPPKTIIITTGAANSSFQKYAQGYKTNLAANGVKLVSLPSEGTGRQTPGHWPAGQRDPLPGPGSSPAQRHRTRRPHPTERSGRPGRGQCPARRQDGRGVFNGRFRSHQPVPPASSVS